MFRRSFLITQRQYKKSLFLFLISLTVIVINFYLVQPYFLVKSNMLQPSTIGFWSNLGNTKQEIIYNAISNPLNIISTIFDKNAGFWFLFGYWLFLPLFSGFAILVGIIELIIFSAANPDSHLHFLSAYYALPFTTIVIIGFILVMFKLYNIANKNVKPWINCLLIVLILFHNITYVRIKDLFYFINNQQITLDAKLYILMQMPLSIGMWQAFYFINSQNLEDFDKMYNDLKSHHINDNICPSNNLYPHFSAITFNNLQKWGDGNFNIPNCINIFTTIGGAWPNQPDQQVKKIQSILLNNKNECYQFGVFYYCNLK